jgi:hypothetical protein
MNIFDMRGNARAFRRAFTVFTTGFLACVTVFAVIAGKYWILLGAGVFVVLVGVLILLIYRRYYSQSRQHEI